MAISEICLFRQAGQQVGVHPSLPHYPKLIAGRFCREVLNACSTRDIDFAKMIGIDALQNAFIS